jgi:hypothetical protein
LDDASSVSYYKWLPPWVSEWTPSTSSATDSPAYKITGSTVTTAYKDAWVNIGSINIPVQPFKYTGFIIEFTNTAISAISETCYIDVASSSIDWKSTYNCRKTVKGSNLAYVVGGLDHPTSA